MSEKEQTTDLIATMAEGHLMKRDYFWKVIRSTVCAPKEFTDEEAMVFLSVAKEMGLSPINGEIYAFKGKNGQIKPLVGIDGWLRRMNEHPMFDGIKTPFNDDEQSCTCTIYRKDRTHPTEVTEYYSECYKKTGPWDNSPKRMLRHRAIIQCVRVAFGSGGAYDEDDRHFHETTHEDLTESTQGTVDDMTARLAKGKPDAVTEIPTEADKEVFTDAELVDGPLEVLSAVLYPAAEKSEPESTEPPLDFVPCNVKGCPKEAAGVCSECDVPLCGNHVNAGLCTVCYSDSL